jgi:hypothetical protein
VYVPAENEPTFDGDTLQVTLVSDAPVTVGVNVCDWFADKFTAAGLKAIDTAGAAFGFSVMLAVADFVGSALLVAVTVRFCAAAIVAGAV